MSARTHNRWRDVLAAFGYLLGIAAATCYLSGHHEGSLLFYMWAFISFCARSIWFDKERAEIVIRTVIR